MDWFGTGRYTNFKIIYNNWFGNNVSKVVFYLSEHLGGRSAHPLLYVPPALFWILPTTTDYCYFLLVCDEQPNANNLFGIDHLFSMFWVKCSRFNHLTLLKRSYFQHRSTPYISLSYFSDKDRHKYIKIIPTKMYWNKNNSFQIALGEKGDFWASWLWTVEHRPTHGFDVNVI